uniref:Uncharacterized protein n=1 Tax=Schistosoma japonicum TaxID=6182 RepID=Q5BX11_SCHJA|nr:unknown [Schistosoma japonicum]
MINAFNSTKSISYFKFNLCIHSFVGIHMFCCSILDKSCCKNC